MRRLLALPAALILLATAHATQLDGWAIKEPRDGEAVSTQDTLRYDVPGQGTVAFFRALPLKGGSLEDFAETFIAFSMGGAETERLATEPMPSADRDGLMVLLLAGSEDDRRHHAFMFREADGQVAASLAISLTDEPASQLTGSLLLSSYGDASEAEVAEAPAASGGLSGYYTVRGSRTQLGPGGYAMLIPTNDLVLFTPDGWMARQTGEGTTACAGPDRPGVCRRYERRGDEIRMESATDTWSTKGWVPFRVTEAGFEAGGKPYVAVGGLTGFAVDAAYQSQTSMSAGGGPGSLGSAAGFGTARYAFGRDGRFELGTSSAVTVEAGGAHPIGGGASTSRDARTGRYAVEGNTLILTFADGETRRLAVRADEDGWRAGDAPPATLAIGGRLFERVDGWRRLP